ncbi:hypothetical protein Tco_0797990 [Tanacetum coccineum]
MEFSKTLKILSNHRDDKTKRYSMLFKSSIVVQSMTPSKSPSASELRKKEQAYNEEQVFCLPVAAFFYSLCRQRMIITFRRYYCSIFLRLKQSQKTTRLTIEEPRLNSLSIGDKHLDTIPATKSDEIIKSSVKNLIPIPSESEGLSDNICDVSSCDNNHFDAEYLLSQDTLITSPKIDFLFEEFAGELAPILPDIHKADFDEEEDDTSELVSLEEVEDVILRDKLSNVYLLISKIEALNDNPTLSYSDNSFSNHTEETRSGSTTTHANNSLPEERRLMLKMTIPSHLSFGLFSHFSPTLRYLPYFSPPGVKTSFLTPASPLRAGGISSGWNFHVL